MTSIIVYDKHGKLLNSCDEKIARILLQRKRAIKIGDNRICFYCSRNIPINEIVTIDHLIPKTIDSNGKCGYDTEENMVCCCYNCNAHKADMNFEDYMIYRYTILIAYLSIKTSSLRNNS